MKRILKSIACLVLAALMAFSASFVALAKTSETPVILVHGLGFNPVYENIGTENEAEIKNLGMGSSIASSILKNSALITQFLRMLDPARKVNEDKLIKSLKKMVASSPLNCDEDGNVKEGQGVINYWTDSLANHKEYYSTATVAESAIARQLCDEVGANNVYVFNYDWRQDICKSAKDLNTLIQTVKKNTGASKVALVGCSLGGAILNAYIDAYKSKKDVSRYVFVNPAIMGVDVSRAYALDINFTKGNIIDYLRCMETAYNNGSSKILFRLIYAIGDVRIGYAAEYLNEFASNKDNISRLYNEVVKPWIGNIPSLWECIPYDSFDKAVKEMSAIGFLDKNSGLYTKIKAYHDVQGRIKSNLQAVKAQGCEVALLASYGTMGIPVTSKANNQTDVLIDTKYASAGATVANYGKKLSSSKAKGSYVSPDKAINASSCALPDNTWFIKDVQHMRFHYNSDATKLVAYLATGKVKSDIASVKEKYGWSQFVQETKSKTFNNVK